MEEKLSNKNTGGGPHSHSFFYIIICALGILVIFLFTIVMFSLKTASIQTATTIIDSTPTANLNSATNTNTNANVNTAINTNRSTNTNTAVSTLETYTNEAYGYSLTLPKEWKEHSALAGDTLATSPSTFSDNKLVLTGTKDMNFQIEMLEDITVDVWLKASTFVETLSKTLQTPAGEIIEVYKGLDGYFYLIASNNNLLKLYTNKITDETDAIAKSFLLLDWKTYTDKTIGFSIEYPSDLDVYAYDKLDADTKEKRTTVTFGSKENMDFLQRLIMNDIGTEGPTPQFILTIDSEGEGANKALPCGKSEVQDGTATFGKFTVPKCTRYTGEIMFPYITYAFLSSDGTRFHFLTGPDSDGLEANDKLDDLMLKSFKSL